MKKINQIERRVLSLVGRRIREAAGTSEILDVDFVFLKVKEGESLFLDVQG